MHKGGKKGSKKQHGTSGASISLNRRRNPKQARKKTLRKVRVVYRSHEMEVVYHSHKTGAEVSVGQDSLETRKQLYRNYYEEM